MKKAIFLIAGALIASPVSNALAENVSPTTIIEALKLKKAPAGARSIRGIGVSGGDDKAPKIDLKVQFEYNEAILTDEAKITLTSLANALKAEELKELSFEIIGHTDARGTDEYNQELSENRAQAVVGYLTDIKSIDSTRLRSSGKGESKLIDPSNPEGGENRRVEIRTIVE